MVSGLQTVGIHVAPNTSRKDTLSHVRIASSWRWSDIGMVKPGPMLSPYIALRMDQTDVYFRQLCRLISRHTWLWTEMIVDTTLIHNPQVWN